MKSKMKRYSVIAGLCAVCLIMVVMIGIRFQTDRPEDDPLPTPDDTVLNIPVVDPSIGTGDNGKDAETADKKTDVVINPNRDNDKQDGRAVFTGTEQTIQPDVKKPDYSEEQLTNPVQTPDGVKVETPPPEVLQDKDNKPPDAPPPTEKPKTNEPKAGDKQNGKIYVPGFGWVDDHGGGGEGIQADDMYENGNKIGIMG